MSIPIVLIAAAGENGEIGLDNKLLWHLPDDFKWFKMNTIRCPIIMGRKTYDSIGKPLPGRLNIVLTKRGIESRDVTLSSSLTDAIEIAKNTSPDKIFIIGGDSVYRQAINYADMIYLTAVHGNFIADSYFPNIDSNWKIVYSMYHPKDINHEYSFEFKKMIRKT